MSLAFTHQDDTPLSGITLTAERGVPSAHVLLKIRNSGVADVVGAFVAMYAETVPGSGLFFTEGHPTVDELMGRFEITGQDASATPGQEVLLGVVQPLGHLAVAQLPTIKPGDWLLAEFWLEQSGSSAGGGAVNIKLEIASDSAAYPLPFGVSQVGHGIDTGRKQARSSLIDGLETTETGTPDDFVHTAPGSWLLAGEEYADGSIEDTQFDQDDGASVALAVGESYIAALTLGTAGPPTVTKGLKGTTPVKPTPPPGELILAWITVNYTAGTTTITSGDIEMDLSYGRYLVVAPASGLNVMVHPGEAVIADFHQVRGQKGLVLLGASVTNRIWLEWNGAITVTTSDTPPSAGAVKLADAITSGSAVTTLTDTRTYINPIGTGVLEIKATGGSPDILGVIELRVPDTFLTDLGGGVAELTFPGTGAAAATLLGASEGVQRLAGTDLSADAEFTLDVDGLADEPAPDADADEVPIWSVAAGVHKKVLLKYLGGIDNRVDFAGDGITQPSTLSPLPLPGCVPMVFIDGRLAIPGGGAEYTDDSAGNIVYTPVLALGQKGTILWRSA